MARASEWPDHPWGRARNEIRFQIFLLALLISCWLPLHVPTPERTKTRCQATTRAGTQCRRMAEPSQRFCWQHQAGRGGNLAGGP